MGGAAPIPTGAPRERAAALCHTRAVSQSGTRAGDAERGGTTLRAPDATARTLATAIDAQRSTAARALAAVLPSGAVSPPAGPLVVTGIGGSEGAASLLALSASRRGLSARFEPLSAFVQPSTLGGHTLVVVSQGLCPNVWLALEARGRFDRTILITCLDPTIDDPEGRTVQRLAASGVVLVTTGAEREPDLLVRIGGPIAAAVASLRLAEAWDPRRETLLPTTLAGTEAIDRAVDGARAAVRASPPRWSEADLSIVTFGESPALAHGLAWTLLEGCLGHVPGVWDVLSIAHGPFQSLYERPATFLALCRHEDARDADLLARLRTLLHPERHAIIVLSGTLPREACAIEHQAAVNAVLAEAIGARPRIDLLDWPGKGRDEPLYGLGQRPSEG